MAVNQQSFHQLMRDAGQQDLLPRFGQVVSSFKEDGSIVTEADLVVQQRLAAALPRFC